MRWSALLLCSLLVAVPAKADRPFQGIEMTSIQRDQLRELRNEKAETRAMREQLISERGRLFGLLMNKQVSRDEVITQVQRVNEMMAQMNVRRAELLLKVREVLTPEQLSVMEKRRKEWRAKHRLELD